MTTLEDVKNVDPHIKDCVFGYVKDAQQLLPDDNVYYTIPTLIVHWILLYYFIKEQFDEECCNSNYELSSNNTIVTKIKSCYKTAYLTQIVSAGVHKWTFKMIRQPTPLTTVIGVWKTKYLADPNIDVDEANGKYYGYSSTHGRTTIGDYNLNDIVSLKYGVRKCKEGDVIEMILDLNKLQLKYIASGEDFGVAFNDIENTSYRVAVCVHQQGDIFQFLKYEEMY